MKYAIIENGTVDNIVISDSPLADNWIEIQDNDFADIGFLYKNGNFISVDPDRSEEIRAFRDEKLKESDWTQVADAPVDKAAWATYRQALRDIPSPAGFPNEVPWPVEP